MPCNKNAERILWIDKAKGIAMLLVIIGHVSGRLTGFWDFKFVYGIHLTMFFLLSGYTFKKHQLTTEYISGKFIRLMKPYFWTCAAILGMDLLNKVMSKDLSIETAANIIYQDLVRSFFASGSITKFGSIKLGTRIGAIWFLPAMFFSVMIFQLLLRFDPDIKKTGIITVCLALLGMISARFIWLPFSIQSAMLAVFFLWLGYYIREIQWLYNVRWYHYVFAQCILLLGIYYGVCNISFAQANTSDVLLSVPTGLSGCLLIYLIANLNHHESLISRIGRNSLVILCTHLFLLNTSKIYIDYLVRISGCIDQLREWLYIFLHILFAVLLAEVVIHFHKIWTRYSLRHQLNGGHRMNTAEIAKGILILLILADNYSISGGLQKIIYSILISGIIFFTGLTRQKSDSIPKEIARLARMYLIPYFMCFLADLLINFRHLNGDFLFTRLKKYMAGMYASKAVMQEIPVIGVLSLLLMLFSTELLLLLIETVCKKERCQAFVSLCFALIGLFLGKHGYWLPWSLDIACYGVLFLYLGVTANRYHALQFFLEQHILYFVLSSVWAYMIYIGSMNLTVRNYGRFGWCILGSLSGIILLYKLSDYFTNHLKFVPYILHKTGSSIWMCLIIHFLLGDRLERLLDSFGFSRNDMPNLIICITVQLILGCLLGKITNHITNKTGRENMISSSSVDI